jgi:ATP-binding cassette, subfamily B, bacterial
MLKFPYFKQFDKMDCGPSCLLMVAKFYGKNYSLQTLKEKSFLARQGVSLLGMSDAAEEIGFNTQKVKISFDFLQENVKLPCIIHWRENHFVVVYKIVNNIVFIADPARKKLKYKKADFLKFWLPENQEMGFALLLEPTKNFYEKIDEPFAKFDVSFLCKYLKPYRWLFIQILIGMLLGSIFQLIPPFLTQAVVDTGIKNKDIGFIKLILFAQLALFISRATVDFIRGWLLLHIGNKVNINLVYDFLLKLVKLPIKFFDIRFVGDIFQRIGDHSRIEFFLSRSILPIIFSLVNLIVFSLVLISYNIRIFFIYLIGSILYILWINSFLKKRRAIDFERFSQSSKNQDVIYQLIRGMYEIKLNSCEEKKIDNWSQIQSKLYNINIKALSLSQFQQTGNVIINETKNILITFFAALEVVNGNITFGMMLAIQYIVGQLNSPIENLISFIYTAQDAKISLERINEIHKREEEKNNQRALFKTDKNIEIQELFYQYGSKHSPYVIKNLSLTIPANKTTAIVGMSGSGKTTLIKLLLGLYEPTQGNILIGNHKLNEINLDLWRKNIGTVMQDGFIFTDTIEGNIALSADTIDYKKLYDAAELANIHTFIGSLPLKYQTKIGSEGVGLSQGQKQRILIARAAYKNPAYLFFDEATNSLDANNEKMIVNNMKSFFKDKTVVIVAHRLSTVKNADQIVVLDEGQIIEKGSHQDLVKQKGVYYNLVKNQLEIDK